MAALYPPWANTVYRLVIALLMLGAAALVALPMLYMRTTHATGELDPVTQPVEFDHRHHVRDDMIDCVYCHSTVETQATAGYPTTELCMGCHAQVWNQSPLLAPVRASWATGEPIPWRRVYDVPDHVYFHHGVHTQAGIACASCHGAVDQMARVYRATPMTMGWCLQCHRDPPGPRWPARRMSPLTTCSACHR